MNKASLLCASVILLISCSVVWADLSTEFAGYTWVKENKVSGLTSSFAAVEAAKIPTSMFTRGPERVSYPGVGSIPSPGGAVGSDFDEGGLGVKVQDGNLLLRVAGTLNPLQGYYYDGWNTWYGQGDVFITVDDAEAGVKNFALLNDWALDGASPSGYRRLDGTRFDEAQKFHTGLNLDGTYYGPDLQGHLVSLSSNSDVVLIGGSGAYTAGTYSLDSRAYAQAGVDQGDAGLVHTTTTDEGLMGAQAWYIQTWTLPMNWLSSDPVFTMGLSKTTTCGNDQIGMVTTVPVPGAVLLGIIGLGAVGVKLRRLAW